MPDIAIVSPECDKVFARMLSLELAAKKSISSVCTDYRNVPYNDVRLLVVSSSDTAAMSEVCANAAGRQMPCVTFGPEKIKNGIPEFVRPFPVDAFVERVYVFLFQSGGKSPAFAERREFSLDPKSKTVIYGSNKAELSAREYELLSYLYENRNRPVSRAELRENVWKTETASNNTDVYINYLRRKLDEKFNKRFIYTLRGEGYQLKI